MTAFCVNIHIIYILYVFFIMKKSFLIHTDSLNIFDALSDDKIWKLFKKIRAYQNWQDFDTGDQIIEILFINFKTQFDRDGEKYENICDRNSNNGKKWWRPKNPNNPVGYFETQQNPKKPKKADSDSDSDSVNDNKDKVKEIEKDIYTSLIFINEEVKKIFIDFINKRKSEEKKVSNLAIELLHKTLTKLYPDDPWKQIQCIEKSIKNWWKDFFELKENNSFDKKKPSNFHQQSWWFGGEKVDL